MKIASNVTSGALVLPAPSPRREPFALPFPYNCTHTLEIECAGLGSLSVPMAQIGNRFFTFSRRTRSWPKSIKFTFSLETLAPFVPAAEVPNHRKQVESIWQTAIHLRIPAGFAKPRKRSDFGALPRKGPPAATAPASTTPLPEKPAPVPTGTIETVLRDDPPKPMPPAADSSRFQLPPEEASSSRRRRSHDGGTEELSQVGFFIFLGALMSFLLGFFFLHNPATRSFGVVFILLTYPSMISSFVLAILGWRKCEKHPNRYEESKTFVTVTLVLSGLSLVLLCFPLVQAIRTGMAWSHTEDPPSDTGDHSAALDTRGEPIDFKQFNFVFHTPASPWRQVDEKRFALHPVVAFAHPDKIFFIVAADNLAPMLLDPRKHVVDISKTNLRRDSSNYKLVSEQETSRNGLAGWQVETEVSIQGHDYYFVQWDFATNGVGYQFSAWGPPRLKNEIKDEAAKLSANFELAPQK